MEQRQREIQKQRAEDRNRWNNRSTPARPSFNNNQKRWEQKLIRKMIRVVNERMIVRMIEPSLTIPRSYLKDQSLEIISRLFFS